MSGLEKSFLRVFGTQLSTPTPRRLDPSQRERVARWAIKTALLLQLWTGAQDATASPAPEWGYYVPKSHLRWLPKHMAPPPATRVWLGAVANPGNNAVTQQSAAFTLEMDKPPVAYFSSFSVGFLLFQVFGTDLSEVKRGHPRGELPTLDPPPSLRQTITEIWPGNGQDAVWPTPRPIEAAAINELAGWPAKLMRQRPQ